MFAQPPSRSERHPAPRRAPQASALVAATSPPPTTTELVPVCARRPVSAVEIYGAVLIGNTLIAVIITVLMPSAGSFWSSLVYSQCIGLSIVTLIVGLRSLIWGQRAAPVALEGALHVVATAGGFLIGNFIASQLLGHSLFGLGDAMLSRFLVISVIASAAYHTLYWYRQKIFDLQLEAVEQARRAEAASRQASEAELGMIRAQLEPHMMFNTLANLRALIRVDQEAAQAMLDRLIAFMRATLSSSRRSRVSLHEEFAMVEDYLQLIAVRLGERLRYTLELPDEVRDQPMLPMLLQPLVENAIRHGIEPAVDGGTIRLTATRQGNRLMIRLSNTGEEFRRAATDHARTHPPGAGFGLQQIRERLETAYDGQARFTIGPLAPAPAQPTRQGALAVLDLPWIETSQPRPATTDSPR